MAEDGNGKHSPGETETFLPREGTSEEKTPPRKKMGFYDRFFASTVRDLKSPGFYRALLGEMLGVMFLVFVGCNSPYGEKPLEKGVANVDFTRISLGFGLAVATLVWLLANVSGGHINPAVTAGMFVTRKISFIRFLLYIIVQCLGGVIGVAVQKGLTCSWQFTYRVETIMEKNLTIDDCGLGMTALSKGVSAGQGFAIEMLITFVLVITVFATCDASRSDLKGSGPLAIGLSVTMCHLAFIPLTGSSMNTARTFGPAVVLGQWDNHWVYWAGPILGGILAGLIYEFVFAGNASMSKLRAWLVDSSYENPEEQQGSQEYELKDGRPANA